MASECILRLRNEGSIDSIRYFECRRTLMEMLRDRGYNVSESDLTLTLPEFRSRFGQFPKPEALGVIVSHRSNPSNKVCSSMLTLFWSFLKFVWYFHVSIRFTILASLILRLRIGFECDLMMNLWWFLVLFWRNWN